MKKKFAILLAVIGAMFFVPSSYAIDRVLHDVADHTIGYGHHRQYYSYGHGNGHGQGHGYSGRRYYRHTNIHWNGGHRRHHSIGRRHLNLGHGRRHGSGH